MSEMQAQDKMWRFDARLNKTQKLLLQHAADLEGRTLADFILQSGEAAAERTMRERALLVLITRGTEVFVQAIPKPARPAECYDRRCGNTGKPSSQA